MEDVIVYDIDNKEYLLTDNLTKNDNNYLYLTNINNPRDIILRKIVKHKNDEFIIKLENDEFYDVMLSFYEKNKNFYQ